MNRNMEILKPLDNGNYKVDYGSSTEEFFESIFETNHDIEEFDIWIEIKSVEDVQKLKKLFQLKGTNVKKLSWINWSKFELTASEVAEMLNCLPNLEFIHVSSWYTTVTGENQVGCLELPHLSSIEINECNNFIFDFLSTCLPENKLEHLKVNNVSDVDTKFNSLIKKHPSIKSINISGDYKTLESLKALKLESLRCILSHKEEETDSQRAFLNELIKSQSDLKSLDLLNDMDFAFNFIDDAIFADICNLFKLEDLNMNIDALSVNGIKAISNLKCLKNIKFKTNRNSSLPVFDKFFASKNSCVEKLILKLWSFDIPAETYMNLGANFEKLKFLRITLGTRHKINFFAKAFPNLEELVVRFGDANNPIELSEAFDINDHVRQSKMKKLRLNFAGSEQLDVALFFKFLQVFDNLESLDIISKFPFCANFVNELADKLNTITSLKVHSFSISNTENFSKDKVDAFKKLQTKLKYAHLTFLNIQHCNFGFPLPPEEQGECRTFTFQPFIDALKDVYSVSEFGFSNIRIHNNLILTAGSEH